ncbi:MAG: hypothetical protein AAB347_05200, partial [Bacteroidota bacterium]
VTLQYDIWQKRFFFEGKDTPESEQKFKLLCKSLTIIYEKSKDSKDFFENSQKYFADNGFLRIAK